MPDDICRECGINERWGGPLWHCPHCDAVFCDECIDYEAACPECGGLPGMAENRSDA